MKKTIDIDLSSDRLIAVAADLVDEHNYISALKLLNKNADMHFNDEDSYMLYAEIFDDVGLFEKCVNSWFKYMDCTFSDDFTEAYEGLAVAYMNLGNEHFSAYYYNKLLMDANDIDPEMRGEIMNSFLSREPNPLKFVYPPKLADCSGIISAGVASMRRGEYDKAIEEFSEVDEENGAYLSARNYIAMCYIISDKCDKAEEVCLDILKKKPDNVQALTTLAAVRTEQKKHDESRELAKRLLDLDVTVPEEIYKIATVCCENKLHAEAYGQFSKLKGELDYDKSVLYFKAISAFNCGKYEESFVAFDRLLTISPEAVIARYHYEKARDMVESGNVSEMSYFYRMPKEERESTFKVLAAFSKLKKTEARKLFSLVDVSDCINWCFDETEGSEETELQCLAADCAIKAELDGMVCDMLLNAFLSDALKVQILTMLGERNEDNVFGVVICHLYKRINFRRLNIGRLKRKNFVTAYARLTAHFAILHNSYSDKFANAAEKLYRKFEKAGTLSSVNDVDALTAVIYSQSGVREPKIPAGQLASFFDTTDKNISKLTGKL